MREIKSVTIVTSVGVKTYHIDEVTVRIELRALYFQGDPYDHYCGFSNDGNMTFSINCLVPCVVEYFTEQL